MKKKVISSLGFILLFFIMIIIVWLLLKQFVLPSDELAESEVKQIVEERYGGVIQETENKGKEFIVSFDRAGQMYQLQINRASGEIEEMSRTGEEKKRLTEQEVKELVQTASLGEIDSVNLKEKSGEEVFVAQVVKDGEAREITLHAVTGKVLSNELANEQPPKNTILTEEEAIEIALQAVQGEVDDVDLENEEDHVFYLIEIETGDEKEAIVEVNAITGESTVTWD